MKHSPDGPYSSADYMSGTTAATVRHMLNVIRDDLELTVNHDKHFLDYRSSSPHACVMVQQYEIYHGNDKVFSFDLLFNEMGGPFNRHEFVESLHKFIKDWKSWQ